MEASVTTQGIRALNYICIIGNMNGALTTTLMIVKAAQGTFAKERYNGSICYNSGYKRPQLHLHHGRRIHCHR